MDTEARSECTSSEGISPMEAVYGMGIKYLLNMPIAAMMMTSFCTYQKSCNNENGVEQGEANHMTKEVFAKPCVGAIIKKVVGNEPYILLQTRQKEDGNETNGMFEIPAGKIREYEDVFSALRREVWAETGLKITKIYGEDSSVCTQIGDVTTISFTPYCVTQNLSGAYSIILNTFLCEAEGDLTESTNETEQVHWEKVSEIKRLLEEHPEKIFFMHINALKKFLKV